MAIARSGTPLPEALSSPTDAQPIRRGRAIEILTSEKLYQVRLKYELYGATPSYPGLPQDKQRSGLDAMLLRDPIRVVQKRKARMAREKEERETRLAELDIEFKKIRNALPRPLPIPLSLNRPTALNPEPTKKRGKPLTRSYSTRDFEAPLPAPPIAQSETTKKCAKPLTRSYSSRDLMAPSVPAPTPTPTTPTSTRRSKSRRPRPRPYPKKKPNIAPRKLERTFSFGSLREFIKIAAIKEDEAVLEALALRNSPPPSPIGRAPPVMWHMAGPKRGFFVYRPGCGVWFKVFVPEEIYYEDPDEEDLRNIFPAGYDDVMKEVVTRREYVERGDWDPPIPDSIPSKSPLPEIYGY